MKHGLLTDYTEGNVHLGESLVASMQEKEKRIATIADKPRDAFVQYATELLTPENTPFRIYVSIPTSVVLGQSVWALVVAGGVPKTWMHWNPTTSDGAWLTPETRPPHITPNLVVLRQRCGHK